MEKINWRVTITNNLTLRKMNVEDRMRERKILIEGQIVGKRLRGRKNSMVIICVLRRITDDNDDNDIMMMMMMMT